MPLIQEKADVVIVGSGPTGAAFARSIADNWPGVTIIMVEAGPVVSNPPGSHVFNMRVEQQPAAEILSQGPLSGIAYAPMTQAEWNMRIAGQPDEAMRRRPGLFAVGEGALDGPSFPAAHASSNVGGMGAHWFGGCPRPSAGERIAFINPEVLDNAFDEAERLMRVATDQYTDSPVVALLKQRLSVLFDADRPEDRVVQAMPMAMVRTASGLAKSGSDVILGDLLDRPQTFLLRPNTICRRIVLDGTRATGIEVWDIELGALRRIEASSVVIAADALHTPQVLFASGIRPKALGHYMNEHFQIGLMVELDTAVESSAAGGVTWVPSVDGSFPFSVTITEAVPSMLPFGAQGRHADRPTIFISLFACSDLVFDNCVAFDTNSLDWRGMPRLLPHLVPTEDDLQRLNTAREVVTSIAQTIGSPLPGFTYMRPPFGSSLHYQGTVRMGETDDGDSVCDSNSRIWGFDNVYVAGNGVIPTVTATNPTLTSVALAVLGGQAVAREHRA